MSDDRLEVGRTTADSPAAAGSGRPYPRAIPLSSSRPHRRGPAPVPTWCGSQIEPVGSRQSAARRWWRLLGAPNPARLEDLATTPRGGARRFPSAGREKPDAGVRFIPSGHSRCREPASGRHHPTRPVSRTSPPAGTSLPAADHHRPTRAVGFTSRTIPRSAHSPPGRPTWFSRTAPTATLPAGPQSRNHETAENLG